MRILVDIRHLARPNLSGVGAYTTELIRALFEIDHVNEYLLLSTGRSAPNLDRFDFPGDRFAHKHIPLPNKVLNLRMSLMGTPTLDRLVDNPVDLIFLPNLNISPLSAQIPTVLTIHDLSWNLFPECYSKKMHLWHRACRPAELINHATKIIVPSTRTKKDLLRIPPLPEGGSGGEGALETKTCVIPHGVHPNFTNRMEARDHGVRSRMKLPKRFVLFVGTLEPRKNLLALIDGLNLYRREYRDDLHLVLVGGWGWKSRAIKKRLWKRDVKSWVHHLGYAPKEDLPAIYRSAEALVWPSLYEGFGLPVLEAMACGTPVITSNTSSLPELTNGAAILIDPYNARDITVALRELLNSDNLQQSLSEKGIKEAKTFTWQKTAKETLAVFEKTRGRM